MKPQFAPRCKVADILFSANHWNQGSFARSSKPGVIPKDVFDPQADKFTLAGAIHRVYGRCATKVLPNLIKAQIKSVLKEHYNHIGTIDEWNDHPDRTFEEVSILIKELDI